MQKRSLRLRPRMDCPLLLMLRAQYWRSSATELQINSWMSLRWTWLYRELPTPSMRSYAA